MSITRMEAKVEITHDEKKGRFVLEMEGLPTGPAGQALAFPIAFTAIQDHAIKSLGLPASAHLCQIVQRIAEGAGLNMDDPTVIPKSRKWKEHTDVH